MIQVRADREVDQTERRVIRGVATVVRLSEMAYHGHAPGAQPDIDGLCAQRSEQVCKSRLPHPLAEIHGVATTDEQSVDFLYLRDPIRLVDTRQSGELQHPDRLPAQL